MNVGEECRSRLEALALDISDSKQTLEALRWGVRILSEMQKCRAGSSSRGEIEADNEAHVGEKRRAVEAAGSPSRKSLRLAGDELSIEEFLQKVERGEFGDWMAKRVAAQVSSPDSMALVKLIDHCLLLSLDQLPGEDALKPGDLNEEQRQHWLALCMASEILVREVGNPERVEFPELDWLLGYFTASHPDIFLPVLLDELLVLQDPVTFHHYVRQATILEFAAQSSPEGLASAISTLLQSFEAAHDKVRHWIVQSALCPKFLTLIARVLAPDLNIESAKIFWKTLLEAHPKLVPLPGYWKSSLEFVLSDAKAWSWILLTKHLESLSPIATELVLFLYEVDPALLDQLNNRLSSSSDDPVNGKSLFLQTLTANLHRLWDNLSSRYLVKPCACSSPLWECRRCLRRDSFLQTCQIVLLRAEDDLVAETLSQATMQSKQLQIIVRLIHVLGVMSREKVFKLWADRLVDRLSFLDSNQVLKGILAIRQLLDPQFWEVHVGGSSWRASWRSLCDVFNQNWLKLLALIHKEERHEVLSNTLGLLLFLSLEATITSEAAFEHLKGALGLFLHHIRESNHEKSDPGNDLREFALLRKIIAELASHSPVTFTLLANILFDVSFEACLKRQMKTTSTCSCELANSVSKPSSQMSVSLAASKLDRYGKLKLVFAPPSDAGKDQTHLLSDENCYRSPGGVLLSNPMTTPSINSTAEEKLQFAGSSFPELCGLLAHSSRKSMGRLQSKSKCWSSSHPAEVLVKLLTDRLATPYEFSMTVEQYEEILPRHVVTVRHTFLMDLFRQNPLLFTALELVMEHGESKELEACTEFVRALLADCISQWHCSMRTQQALKKLMSQDTSRMQVYNVIQLVNLAHWLPQPLASCGEVISLIRPEDITSLLFLIWRCMHDNLKRPAEGNRVKPDENSPRDWRGQFLGILRHNISQIGAHFARLYPQF